MFVCCECCVLSGRGLCDKLITEESYRLWWVFVYDLETNLVNEEALAHWGMLRPPPPKGKTTSLQAWTGLQGSKRLRLPEALDSLNTGTYFS